jgi:tRNA pseudouridine55 synthase
MTALALPLLSLRIECSSGTYIRSLAHDLGQRLGCGGYLQELTRIRSGIFGIEESLTVTNVEEAFNSKKWQQLLYPLDYPLQGWNKVIVTDRQLKLLKDGLTINIEGILPDGRLVCAYDKHGYLAAILSYQFSNNGWKHEVLFNV